MTQISSIQKGYLILKYFIKKNINLLLTYIQLIDFHMFLYIKNTSKRVFVIDIDNTICDTGNFRKQHRKKEIPETFIFRNVPIYINAWKFLEYLQSKNETIVLLSAREPKYLKISKAYFKSNKIYPDKIYCIERVKNKRNFFINKQKITYYFYDDMSFGHEKNKLGFYKEEISYYQSITSKKFNFSTNPLDTKAIL